MLPAFSQSNPLLLTSAVQNKSLDCMNSLLLIAKHTLCPLLTATTESIAEHRMLNVLCQLQQQKELLNLGT